MAQNSQQNNQIAGAITYPSRSDGNVQQVPVELRQPRNLQGLLRFAMEATIAEDAPNISQMGPMTEERRKFLEEALKSMTVDIISELQNAIKVLTDTEKMGSIQLGEPLPEDVDIAFNKVLDAIEDVDTSNDFYKLGGFAIFPVAYGSENEEVRAQASTVLAGLCQNNGFCQARALECGLLNVLLNMVQSERGRALAQSLYAISCAIREHQPALTEFLAQGGCEALLHVLDAAEGKAVTRAAFLASYLCRRNHEAKKQFIKLNLIRTLAKQIEKGHSESTEHLLSTILSLVEEQDDTVLGQCRDPTLGLKNILEKHLTQPDFDGNRFCEERQYCQELLRKIFASCPQEEPIDDVVADR